MQEFEMLWNSVLPELLVNSMEGAEGSTGETVWEWVAMLRPEFDIVIVVVYFTISVIFNILINQIYLWGVLAFFSLFFYIFLSYIHHDQNVRSKSFRSNISLKKRALHPTFSSNMYLVY